MISSKYFWAAVGANALWGLLYVFPLLLHDYSPLELTLGRFISAGLFGTFILTGALVKYPELRPLYKKPSFVAEIFFLALLGSVLYFLMLMTAVRLSSPCLVTMVVGFTPIGVSLYGNFIHREYPFSLLTASLSLLSLGIIVINYSALEQGIDAPHALGGTLLTLTTVFMWSYFAVRSKGFLQENPSVGSWTFGASLGIASGLLISVLAPLISWGTDSPIALFHESLLSPDARRFVLTCLVMGPCVTFLPISLWNTSLEGLPVSFAGQLLVLETVFGLLYVHLYENSTPAFFELVGVAIFILGVTVGLHKISDYESA